MGKKHINFTSQVDGSMAPLGHHHLLAARWAYDANGAVSFRKMSTHQIWTFFQEAKAAGISGVRRVGDQGGVKTGTVSYWQRRLLGMYSENAKLSLLNINHIACVADGSKHSNREFLVSLFLFLPAQSGMHGDESEDQFLEGFVPWPNESDWRGWKTGSQAWNREIGCTEVHSGNFTSD